MKYTEQYRLYQNYKCESWYVQGRDGLVDVTPLGGVPLTREQRILKLEHELGMTGHHDDGCSCSVREVER